MASTSLVHRLFSQSVINHFYHLPLSVLSNFRYGFPAQKMQIIGVTGTDGKTTTSSAIYHVISSNHPQTGLLTTVEAIIDGQKINTGFHTTTPSADKLQSLLAKGRHHHIDTFVIESTSHGLDQNRLWGIPFKIGVLTNISHEHLDYHHTFENYLAAKAKLFNSVKYAVLNQDDQSFSSMSEYIQKFNPNCQIFSYSITNPQSNIYANNIELTPQQTKFEIIYNLPKSKGQLLITTQLIGEFNISNLLAAYGACLAYGISPQIFGQSISAFQPVSGRQQKLEIHNRNIYIDFAHTPNAMKSLLQTVKKIHPRSRIILVFGATGQRDQAKRPLMGQIASDLATVIILTSDDTYNEPINQIITQIEQGIRVPLIKDPAQETYGYMIIPDRQQAIDQAVAMSGTGDCIVLMGKGHEQSINLSGVEHSWSESQSIQIAFTKLTELQISQSK